jgi:hypothetical protein
LEEEVENFMVVMLHSSLDYSVVIDTKGKTHCLHAIEGIAFIVAKVDNMVVQLVEVLRNFVVVFSLV